MDHINQSPSPDLSGEFVQPSEEVEPMHILQRVGDAALSAFVAVEVNPLTNEGLRLGAFAAAQTATGNPYIAAATFAGTTFAIEASGAFATAKLLASKTGEKVVAKMNNVIEKMKLDRFMRTNLITEAGIAAVAGSPAAVLIKHRQDIERTESQNQGYGLMASLGITAMSGAQGLMVAEGISAPSPTTIGVATLAVGATLGLGRWIKTKASKTASEEL